MQNGDQFIRAGDGTGVTDHGWEPGVISVVFCLTRSVRAHLKKRLRIQLSAIVIIPARIRDASVVQDTRMRGVDLIEPEPTQILPVLVARVQITDLRLPAINRLHTARRNKNNVAVWEVTGLIISHPFPERQLTDFARLSIHLEQVKIVVIDGGSFLPGKQDFCSIKRNIDIADNPRFIFEQRFHFACFYIEHTERGTG